MNNKSIRWLYLTLATITLMFLGTLYAWSIFRDPLSQMFTNWTATQMSLTFTISIITFCCGSIYAGKIFSRWTSKTILALSAFLLFLGFFGVSLFLKPENPTSSLTALYIFYGIFCGFGVGIGYNGSMSTLMQWFPDKPGLASGVLLMGFGIGGLALGSIIDVLCGSLGLLQTFRIIAVATAIVLGLSAILIKRPTAEVSEELGLLIVKKEEGISSTVKDVPPSRILRLSVFWILCVWLIFTNAGGLLVINSAAPIAAIFGAPASMGLIVSLFNGGGRLVFGAIFDKFGQNVAFILNSLILLSSGLCLFAALQTGLAALMFVGISLVGLSYGGSPAISSAATSKFWGTKYYSANFSYINCTLIPAAILGPMIASALQEQAGGAYDSTFVMLTLFGVAALFTGIFLMKKITKTTYNYEKTFSEINQ